VRGVVAVREKGRLGEEQRELWICQFAGEWNWIPRTRGRGLQSCSLQQGGREEEIMGSGIGALLVLLAACLASAPPCTLVSSRK